MLNPEREISQGSSAKIQLFFSNLQQQHQKKTISTRETKRSHCLPISSPLITLYSIITFIICLKYSRLYIFCAARAITHNSSLSLVARLSAFLHYLAFFEWNRFVECSFCCASARGWVKNSPRGQKKNCWIKTFSFYYTTIDVLFYL